MCLTLIMIPRLLSGKAERLDYVSERLMDIVTVRTKEDKAELARGTQDNFEII